MGMIKKSSQVMSDEQGLVEKMGRSIPDPVRAQAFLTAPTTVFIQLSAQGAYLIFGLSGWALI